MGIPGFAGAISLGAHTQDLTRQLGHILKIHPPSSVTIVQQSSAFFCTKIVANFVRRSPTTTDYHQD